jgi:hypothetical protein
LKLNVHLIFQGDKSVAKNIEIYFSTIVYILQQLKSQRQ